MRNQKPGQVGQNGENDGSFIIGRRHALRLLGRVGVLCGVAGNVACNSSNKVPLAEAAIATPPRALSDAEFKLLSRLTDLIIPKTDTAGAIEVGVPEFIDAALEMSKTKTLPGTAGAGDYAWDNLNILFAEGLRWVDTQANSAHSKNFLELERGRQFALLETAYASMEAEDSSSRNAQFLRTLKNLTVEGYYSSREGLLSELGYKGNTPHEMGSDSANNADGCDMPAGHAAGSRRPRR